MTFINDLCSVMAKNKEKKLAYIYYVEQGKTAKACAQLIGVTEATMSRWVDKGKWKAERDSKLFSAKEQIKNIKNIINNCAEERLALNEQLNSAIKDNDRETTLQIRQKMAGLSDEVSKWNKALVHLDKQNKIELSTYIQVMKEIFKAIQLEHPTTYLKLIDFQENFIRKKAIEIG